MKNSTHTLYLSLILLLLGCAKDEVVPMTSTSILEFANIEVGSYWVYEWHIIEPEGTESPYNLKDSLVIERDTIISGKQYFIRSGTLLESDRTEILLFDSLNSIFIYPSNEILFTIDETIEETKFYGPAEEPVATGIYALSGDTSTVIVPAGEFECMNYQGLIEVQEPDYEFGIRENDNLYANGIGLVLMKTQFLSSPNDLEMRLVRYGKIQ